MGEEFFLGASRLQGQFLLGTIAAFLSLIEDGLPIVPLGKGMAR
jgi:hypothetical protein